MAQDIADLIDALTENDFRIIERALRRERDRMGDEVAKGDAWGRRYDLTCRTLARVRAITKALDEEENPHGDTPPSDDPRALQGVGLA